MQFLMNFNKFILKYAKLYGIINLTTRYNKKGGDKDMSYSIKEVLVLEALLSGNNSTKANAISTPSLVKILNKNLVGNMSEVSLSTARRAIAKFIEDGYVDRGINLGRVKTYFITETGKIFVNECMGEDDE